MLDRFYELQGWDKETSLQIGQALIGLGLDDVANVLERAGKLL
jgi:hypothetical protein